ncbi:MAG: T9SS type A sorting domain-containing protein [Flavobacteriaceae bacterium]
MLQLPNGFQTATIYSLLGKKVYENKHISNINNTINLPSLPVSIYVLPIEDDTTHQGHHYKFVVD